MHITYDSDTYLWKLVQRAPNATVIPVEEASSLEGIREKLKNYITTTQKDPAIAWKNLTHLHKHVKQPENTASQIQNTIDRLNTFFNPKACPNCFELYIPPFFLALLLDQCVNWENTGELEAFVKVFQKLILMSGTELNGVSTHKSETFRFNTILSKDIQNLLLELQKEKKEIVTKEEVKISGAESENNIILNPIQNILYDNLITKFVKHEREYCLLYFTDKFLLYNLNMPTSSSIFLARGKELNALLLPRYLRKDSPIKDKLSDELIAALYYDTFADQLVLKNDFYSKNHNDTVKISDGFVPIICDSEDESNGNFYNVPDCKPIPHTNSFVAEPYYQFHQMSGWTEVLNPVARAKFYNYDAGTQLYSIKPEFIF